VKRKFSKAEVNESVNQNKNFPKKEEEKKKEKELFQNDDFPFRYFPQRKFFKVDRSWVEHRGSS